MPTELQVLTLRLSGRPLRRGAKCLPRSATRRLRVQALRHERQQKRPVPNTDIVGFLNLCLDVRLRVPRLPEQRRGWREAFMHDYLLNPPADSILEPGGVNNTLLAASRLGLSATVVGHVGDDAHGAFCKECLLQECVGYVPVSTQLPGVNRIHPLAGTTPFCLVIVDPMQRHLFCSSFEVTPGLLYTDPSCLSAAALEQIRAARVLFVNGYAFQEASRDVLKYVCELAIDSGGSTFFDPGPFGSGLAQGSSEDKQTLLDVLQRSHVILATQEEAACITGKSDPLEAARALLSLTGVTRWVVIKLGERGSLFVQRGQKRALHTAGFSVPVSDTVGCGDSFAAAVAYGYLRRQGERPEGVMELANAIGAITATGCGAGRNVADLSEVKALLRHHLSDHSPENGGSGIGAALDLLSDVPASAGMRISSST